MKKLLIVDDEIQILKALSRLFFDTDYKILTAESGDIALKLLEENEINLIISDMRMPLMSGCELLSEVKKLYPNIIRVILSGYSDEESIFKAILHNLAKFYILKPWNNDNLLKYINQIFETEDILNSNHLLQLINNLEKLPTIQESYQRILNMIDKDSEIFQIALEIEKDLAISSKLLQVANSAYFGVKTGSVRHAAIYLGLHNLKSLIYSTAIINSNGKISLEEKRYTLKLWDHAVLTNRLLHYIFESFLGEKVPESAFSAGLLHNIGKLIIVQNYFDKYLSFLDESKSETSGILEKESSTFGVTHQEIGGYLVSWWELPFSIVESTLFHHKPLESIIINKKLVAAVHISQHYAYKLMNEPLVNAFYPETFEILGISLDEFEAGLFSNPSFIME